MALVEDNSSDTIEIFKRGKVHILDDNIEERREVLGSLHASIDVMARGDTVQVINIRLHTMQYFHSSHR